MSVKVFAIGNGESRKCLDLMTLKPYGKTIACNAAYRDFTPDYLVSVDPKMRREIEEAKVIATLLPSYQGWASGPSAVEYAVRLAEQQGEVYLLGFDLYGTEDGKHNNIYKGTPNYRAADAGATYYGNWVKQIGIVLARSRHVQFYRVGRETDPMPAPWAAENIKFISYAEMWEGLR